MSIARKGFVPIEFKLDESGAVTAAFAQLNVIDKDGDVTLPGAIPTKAVPMSGYGHTSWDGALPVGKGDISESGDWGVFRGQFFMDTDQGRNAHATVKAMGDLQEWSYGLRPVEFSFGKQDGQDVRFLKSLDVFEVSPVLIGAGVGTHTRAIKGASLGSEMALADHGPWVREQVAEYLDRVRAKAALRAADGRGLGTSRDELKALLPLLDRLDPEQAAEVRSFLEESDPDRAARLQRLQVELLLGQARALGVPV